MHSDVEYSKILTEISNARAARRKLIQKKKDEIANKTHSLPNGPIKDDIKADIVARYQSSLDSIKTAIIKYNSILNELARERANIDTKNQERNAVLAKTQSDIRMVTAEHERYSTDINYLTREQLTCNNRINEINALLASPAGLSPADIADLQAKLAELQDIKTTINSNIIQLNTERAALYAPSLSLDDYVNNMKKVYSAKFGESYPEFTMKVTPELAESDSSFGAHARPEPAKPEPGKPEPAKTEPGKPAPARPEPGRPAPARPEPGRPAPARPEPGRPAPVRPEPGRPAPARPESDRPEPPRLTPSNPAPNGVSMYDLKRDIPNVIIDKDGKIFINGALGIQDKAGVNYTDLTSLTRAGIKPIDLITNCEKRISKDMKEYEKSYKNAQKCKLSHGMKVADKMPPPVSFKHRDLKASLDSMDMQSAYMYALAFNAAAINNKSLSEVATAITSGDSNALASAKNITFVNAAAYYQSRESKGLRSKDVLLNMPSGANDYMYSIDCRKALDKLHKIAPSSKHINTDLEP